jgi:putative transposase
MRPKREPFRQSEQTYFVTFQTAQRQAFFRNERWALELVQTFQRYTDNFDLHDFVIMYDHVHLLLSPQVPLERAVQLIKGGFSFNARCAFEWKGDIWQSGFTDHRIRDERDCLERFSYIKRNVTSLHQEGYRFCGEHSGLPLASVPPWLKPLQGADL